MRSLYKGYFQKSKVFLYPVLGIARGISTVPEETYIAWPDRVKADDPKLICLYNCTTDPDFEGFRNNVLLKHKLLDDIVLGTGEDEIYIFDLTGIGKDYQKFLNGRYSEFSEEHKNIVLDFFVENDRLGELILSYLNPSEHYVEYARLLGVDEKLLEEVGELCTAPDLIKETLILNI